MIEDQFYHAVTTFDNWYSLSFWTLFATSETAIVYITEFINISDSIAIDCYLQVHIYLWVLQKNYQDKKLLAHQVKYGPLTRSKETSI